MALLAPELPWVLVPTDAVPVPLNVLHNNQCRQASTTIDRALLHLLANASVWTEDPEYCRQLDQDMYSLQQLCFPHNRAVAYLCGIIQRFAQFGYKIDCYDVTSLGVTMPYWDNDNTLTIAQHLERLQRAPVALTSQTPCNHAVIIASIMTLLNAIEDTDARVGKVYLATYVMAYLVACQDFLVARPKFTTVVLQKLNHFRMFEASSSETHSIFSPVVPFLIRHILGTPQQLPVNPAPPIKQQKAPVGYWLDLSKKQKTTTPKIGAPK